MDALIPVLDSAGLKKCDSTTRAGEPISGIDLMERAARAIFNCLKTYLNKEDPIHVVCGPGNNGGDGLCIAGMLIAHGYTCRVSLCIFGKKQSAENTFQSDLLKLFSRDCIAEIQNQNEFDAGKGNIILDCIFGSGLNTAVTGDFAHVINSINSSGSTVFSADIPTGLFDAEPQENAIYIKAKKTVAIQTPRPSFFYPENAIDFEIINAGIQLPDNQNTFFLSPEEPYKSALLNSIEPKPKFTHKGTFGHALLAGGNDGMHGAIAMAAKACLEQGAGLTTVLAPEGAAGYLSSLPKAMYLKKPLHSASAEELEMHKYSTLAVGPGLGNAEATASFLERLLKQWNKPVLLDADALNILAITPALWQWVLPSSILTPHPGEFKRLFGETKNGKEKFELAKQVAMDKKIFILAKDTYSALYTPDGKCFFNGSGSAHLAQGGSGDVLTGTIAGLWARTGNAELAATMGMYIAGL